VIFTHPLVTVGVGVMWRVGVSWLPRVVPSRDDPVPVVGVGVWCKLSAY
jgi:hypothetical protein